MFFSRLGAGLALAVGALSLSACSTGTAPIANYEPDAFGDSMYTRHYAATPAQTCEAARRALLSQGYVITDAKEKEVTGRKLFQPDVKHHVQMEFRVVCALDGADRSLAFASATQDQYVAKPASNSASVGVGGIGSLSLPFQGGLDSMVKISSQTVTNQDVYDSLFTLMKGYLSSVERIHWKPDETKPVDAKPADQGTTAQKPAAQKAKNDGSPP
ncbi:MAG: DUF2242 domain-containing protein [Burkholderiaceae bacterium]|nr:MAG: DUF2242 domain-containing protein [Burkholderiaceae bacterium]